MTSDDYWYFLKFPIWVIKKGLFAEMEGSEQAVLVLLCLHANKRGVCWPSVETLRKGSGYCRRSVQTALDNLEARGVVKRQGRRVFERTWNFLIIGLGRPERGG